ncbi:MAG: ArsR/SmtB family transcription factor [Solirubrobacterales bacterium]
MAARGPLDAMEAEDVAQRFAVLADANRLLILDHLGRHGEAAVGEVALAVGASQQNTSKHLAVLRTAGMVVRRKRATSALYRVSDERVNRLCEEARN